ncbi:MAG: N-acetyl-alpha-D-glucosaminyl L-malate synthase BshA [Acidobacteria bacterium]|nr:N-acetyl-alpha-D-glucosaminyl L-malate synthase BshA [Acidobacteriota bacterium]
MRIGITCYPTYGGSGIVATELGLELAMRGHEIHFISYANPIRLDPGLPRIHYHEVEVSNYPLFQYPPYCLALASHMAEVAERYHLDLLHVHYAIPHSTSASLARDILKPKRRLPFVTTLHGTDITLVGTDRSYYPITKYSIEQSDGVTTISDYMRRRTIDVFHVANDIDVIGNFVNVSMYRPDPAARPERKRLMHVSNFREVKRPLDCVRILAYVRREVDAELMMVGDGPLRGPCESLAWDLGVQDHVTFLGKQDHVERLFPRAHILLMPSELEAFGLAALEAMACGLPPVATACGGVPELVADGVTGFLEPVGDVEAQARRVVQLLTDEALYRAMAQAARHDAVTRFSTDLIIPKYESHYERVLSAK